MKEFFETLISTWWGILIICILAAAVWIFLSALLYRRFFKRFYDIVLSGIGIAILSPVFLMLIVLGAVKMKGNPFFTQLRPGKDEKIFRLIKFRTMTCEKDSDGNLLPDEKRLTRYGRILRSTSLDELPELFNIFVGQMSIVGPRPLLVQYLDLYTEEPRIVKQKYPEAVFNYLGAEGDLKIADIQEFISDGSINYLGTTDDVRPFLEDCSVFILPSYYGEGLPMSIMEAEAVGRAIITTNNVGCRDTVIDGYNGFLVEKQNVEDLVNKIEAFLIDHNLLHQFGNNSHLLAARRFDQSIALFCYIIDVVLKNRSRFVRLQKYCNRFDVYRIVSLVFYCHMFLWAVCTNDE